MVTRICPKCNGTQMVEKPAKDDHPPKNALAYGMRLGTVIFWIVWCDCKEGFR